MKNKQIIHDKDIYKLSDTYELLECESNHNMLIISDRLPKLYSNIIDKTYLLHRGAIYSIVGYMYVEKTHDYEILLWKEKDIETTSIQQEKSVNTKTNKWCDYFFNILNEIAKGSTCVKYNVGALVVKDNRILCTGYNGTISGFENCNDRFNKNNYDGEEHHKWSRDVEVHAEMNVLMMAAKYGIAIENATLYCTHHPCANCLKHLCQAGIKKVIYKEGYLREEQREAVEALSKYIEIVKYE